jgi:type II secretory pathway pseudopilin PulG
MTNHEAHDEEYSSTSDQNSGASYENHALIPNVNFGDTTIKEKRSIRWRDRQLPNNQSRLVTERGAILPHWPERGVTFVEIMIIAAAVAILLAIVVPNYSDSKTRAHLTTVDHDFRQIAIALQSYGQEFRTYPGDHIPGREGDRAGVSGPISGLTSLTTPIAYLPTLPPDPFSSSYYAKDGPTTYYFGSGSDNQQTGHVMHHSFVLLSRGPDGSYNATGLDSFPWDASFRQYDPINGVNSFGDIVGIGGSTTTGTWQLNYQTLTDLRNTNKLADVVIDIHSTGERLSK